MAQEQTDRKLKAPRWFLALMLFVIVAHALDAAETLANMPQYQAVTLPFSPAAKAAFSAIWSILLTVLFVGLLRRRRAAFAWAAPLLTIVALAGLLWEIVFVRADYGRSRLGFQAFLTVIVLAPVWWLAVRGRWLTREAKSLTVS